MRNVKMIISVVMMVLGAWESEPIAYGELVGTWTILDHPLKDAKQTRAYGIDGDNIVGTYYESPPGQYYAFLYDGGWHTLEDAANRNLEQACGVDDGKIVGLIGNTSFLWNNGASTLLNAPWAIQTHAYGIDGDNIVGYAGDHGFLYDYVADIWTTIDYPGASSTYVYGIDGDNIVGYAGGHGFLYDYVADIWTTFDAPSAVSTQAYGIDGDNIVGTYYDSSGECHGFLYDGTDWTSLDMPGTYSTNAMDIDGDNIVGHYNAHPYLTDLHGFVYTIPEPSTLLLLGLGAVMLRRKRSK